MVSLAVGSLIDAEYMQAKLLRWLWYNHNIVLPNVVPAGWFECDVLAVSPAGYSTEYEVKRSKGDFYADRQKIKRYSTFNVKTMQYERDGRPKHERMAEGDLAGPSRFFFVCPEDLLLPEKVPEWAGLIWVCEKGYNPVIKKPAKRLHEEKMNGLQLKRFLKKTNSRYVELLLQRGLPFG